MAESEDVRTMFWITRRFLTTLLFEIESFLEGKVALDALPDLTEKGKTNRSDEENTTSSKQEWMGDALLETIDLKWHENEQLVTLKWRGKSREVFATMTPIEAKAVLNLLKKAIPKMEWGIVA